MNLLSISTRLVITVILSLSAIVGMMMFLAGATTSQETEKPADRFVVRQVNMPDTPKNTELQKAIEQANSVIEAINSGNIMAVAKDLNSFESVGSRLDLNFVVKSGNLAHLTCSNADKKGFMVNFRSDGTISMYTRGTLEPMTGIAIWFSPLGNPTSLQSVVEGKLLGWQYGWDKQGKLVREEEVKTPRKIELYGGQRN